MGVAGAALLPLQPQLAPPASAAPLNQRGLPSAGTIPPELSGTLLRNGPALFEVGSQPIPQPFDGDGMAAQFAFRGGRVFFANRFVRTEAFVKEQQAGKMLFRGAFSTGAPEGQWLFNPFDFSIKKVANTGIFHWGGRTLALYERDLPYELEGPDLRTKGATDLGGAILADSPWIAAHYRQSREDGERRAPRVVSFQEGCWQRRGTQLMHC